MEMEQRSDKSRGVAAVLCFFLGGLGIHRFYVGKIGTGLLNRPPKVRFLV